MVNKLLTKEAKVTTEASRISRLTEEHSEHFKVILSHQINKKFNFHSMQSNKGTSTTPTNALKMFKALGDFIDDSVHLSITEVEEKYKRPSDRTDATYDPESESKVQVEHFCLYEEGATPLVSDSVRLHGYARTNGGYFVITKLDWFHTVHKK